MNKFFKKTITALNSVINIAVMVILIILLIIGCYALWDNKLMTSLGNKSQWKAYMPKEGNQMGFDELRTINPEVIGWLTIYGTGIDYPVLYHSDDTAYYLFRDPTGKSSIVGSIFLDCRSNPHFSDYASIIYGHHMEEHSMFGDLDLFKRQDFFNSHEYGNLYFDNTNHGLKIISSIETNSLDKVIYQAGSMSESSKERYFSYVKDKSKFWRNTAFDFAQHLVVLSTCSGETDEARSVLVTEMTDQTYENPFEDEGYEWPGVEDLKGWLGFPWTAWFSALVVLLLLAAYILWQVDKKKKAKRKNDGAYDKY